MKLIPFYETHAVNGIVTSSKVFFNPKGQNKYYAVLEYKWKHLHSYTELDTDHRVDRRKFAMWSQVHLNVREKEFYEHLVMTKLKYGIVSSTEDVVSSFKSYVVV
jgi:hypothetical protein